MAKKDSGCKTKGNNAQCSEEKMKNVCTLNIFISSS